VKEKTIKEILRLEGYSSGEAFAKDATYFLALTRVEQYRAECEFFERKYGMKLEDFHRSLCSVKGEENFGREEDLEDWEFAEVALRWWEEK
jgi:hypothetical protein